MLASKVMKDPVFVRAEGHVREALDKMLESGLRMLPVVDADRRVVGIFSTLSVLEHLVPEYIASGDLDDIPYAPDFGVLHRHYGELEGMRVADLMDRKIFVVKPDESLLSVAASLITHVKHDCVLVIDDDENLTGIITSGDVLHRLRSLNKGESRDD